MKRKVLYTDLPSEYDNDARKLLKGVGIVLLIIVLVVIVTIVRGLS